MQRRTGRGRWIEQHSAGGVVIRGEQPHQEFLAIRPAGKDRWQLPKGGIDAGETPEEAAVREVHEEGGVRAEIVAALDPIRYFYQAGGRRFAKVVDFYLMRYLDGDPSAHDREVDEARWLPLDQADRLTFPSERSLVVQARELLATGE